MSQAASPVDHPGPANIDATSLAFCRERFEKLQETNVQRQHALFLDLREQRVQALLVASLEASAELRQLATNMGGAPGVTAVADKLQLAANGLVATVMQ